MRQRLLFYNCMIRLVLHYFSSMWCSCDKVSLGRVLKLQKRAARVIVKLFNRLQWLPFYAESKVAKWCVAYKRIKGEVPLYAEGSLILNSQQHNRVLQDITTLLIFVQDLIVWLKATDHLQSQLVNFVGQFKSRTQEFCIIRTFWSAPVIKKITSRFSSDFESVFA